MIKKKDKSYEQTKNLQASAILIKPKKKLSNHVA
jgi:hypothetical protein